MASNNYIKLNQNRYLRENILYKNLSRLIFTSMLYCSNLCLSLFLSLRSFSSVVDFVSCWISSLWVVLGDSVVSSPSPFDLVSIVDLEHCLLKATSPLPRPYSNLGASTSGVKYHPPQLKLKKESCNSRVFIQNRANIVIKITVMKINYIFLNKRTKKVEEKMGFFPLRFDEENMHKKLTWIIRRPNTKQYQNLNPISMKPDTK